jgi:hypothetical protein
MQRRHVRWRPVANCWMGMLRCGSLPPSPAWNPPTTVPNVRCAIPLSGDARRMARNPSQAASSLSAFSLWSKPVVSSSVPCSISYAKRYWHTVLINRLPLSYPLSNLKNPLGLPPEHIPIPPCSPTPVSPRFGPPAPHYASLTSPCYPSTLPTLSGLIVSDCKKGRLRPFLIFPASSCTSLPPRIIFRLAAMYRCILRICSAFKKAKSWCGLPLPISQQWLSGILPQLTQKGKIVVSPVGAASPTREEYTCIGQNQYLPTCIAIV